MPTSYVDIHYYPEELNFYVDSKVKRALDKWRYSCEATMKKLVSGPSTAGKGGGKPPGVDSTRMLFSITSGRKEFTAWAGSKIAPRPGQPWSYPKYLEHGTKNKGGGTRMEERPWMVPSWELSKHTLFETLRK